MASFPAYSETLHWKFPPRIYPEAMRTLLYRHVGLALVLILTACTGPRATATQSNPFTPALEPGSRSAASAPNSTHTFARNAKPIVSDLHGFGLVVGSITTTLTAHVRVANYDGPFLISVRGESLDVTCEPRSCKPASAGTDVVVTIAPQKVGSGTLTISDTQHASIRVPYRVSRLTIHDGPSPNGPNWCLDSDGQVWSVDPNRANTFYVIDKNGFTTFRVEIAHARLGACAGGENGEVWFIYTDTTTETATFGVLDRGFHMRSYPDKGNPKPDPLAIVRGPDENMWVTDGAYLDRIAKDGSITYLPIIPSQCVFDGLAATFGARAAIWAGANCSSVRGAVYRVTTAGTVTMKPLPALLTTASGSPLTSAANDSIWLTLRSGVLCSLAGTKLTCGQGVGYELFSNLVYGSDGAVWALATPKKLLRFTSLTSHITYDGLTTLTYSGAITGAEGSIWFPGDNAISVLAP